MSIVRFVLLLSKPNLVTNIVSVIINGLLNLVNNVILMSRHLGALLWTEMAQALRKAFAKAESEGRARGSLWMVWEVAVGGVAGRS